MNEATRPLPELHRLNDARQLKPGVERDAVDEAAADLMRIAEHLHSVLASCATIIRGLGKPKTADVIAAEAARLRVVIIRSLEVFK